MKTKDKIIAKAIMLFNKQGVANVRLQDIANECHISPGNLNYHFKLKKDLILAVLDYMTASFQLMKGDYEYKLDQNNYAEIVKSFLNFQIRHRFFYRDILQISSFSDEAVTVFEYQMNGVINFTYNGMNLAVDKGLIRPEPHEGHYRYFAKSMWAILSSWLNEREILGDEKVNVDAVTHAIWECHYPYLTEAGQLLFRNMKNRLSEMIEAEAL